MEQAVGFDGAGMPPQFGRTVLQRRKPVYAAFADRIQALQNAYFPDLQAGAGGGNQREERRKVVSGLFLVFVRHSQRPKRRKRHAIREIRPFVRRAEKGLQVVTPAALLFGIQYRPNRYAGEEPRTLCTAVGADRRDATDGRNDLPRSRSHGRCREMVLQDRSIGIRQRILSPQRRYNRVPAENTIPQRCGLLFNAVARGRLS